MMRQRWVKDKLCPMCKVKMMLKTSKRCISCWKGKKRGRYGARIPKLKDGNR